jgi:MFS family permease
LVFRNRQFRPLYWIQFLGALNDNFLKNGMVILVEYQGLSLLGLEPPAIVALAGAIFILPFFLFSMLAGQIADRFDKRTIIRVIKVWEILITVTSALGFYQHNLWILLAALFMMGCHSTFFGPIKYSALPDLVRPDQLVTANAYVEVGTFLAILFGTIGGGILISLAGGEGWISLVINVCAVVGLIMSLRMQPLPSHAPNLRLQWKPFSLMLTTYRQLKRKASVYNSILGISWFWAFGAAVLSLLPPYCKEYLHVNEHVVTTFLAMFTVGIGVGSMVCERLSGGKIELGLVPIGSLGMTLFLLDLSQIRPALLAAGAPLMSLTEFALSPHGPRLLIDFTMMSVFGGFFILPLYTTLQARSEKRSRSRVIAGNNVFNSIFMVVGAVFVMVCHLYQVSLPTTFLLLAIFNVVAAAYIYTVAPEFRLRFYAKVRRTFSGNIEGARGK